MSIQKITMAILHWTMLVGKCIHDNSYTHMHSSIHSLLLHYEVSLLVWNVSDVLECYHNRVLIINYIMGNPTCGLMM